MDERSHHQPPMPNAQDGRGFGQQQGRPRPWPGAAPSSHAMAHHASMPAPAHQVAHHDVLAWQAQGGMPAQQPLHGHDHGAHGAGIQPQALPTPQYAYAAGFVLPGAAGGQAPPMAAHGATIGTPLPHAAGMPAHAQAPGAAAAWQHGSVATSAAPEAAQAWAYQTPQGLQLVQPGAAAYAQQPMAAVAGAGSGPAARRRVRWETIVPGAAVACLVAAVALFVTDFDRMTGRDAGSVTTSPARAMESAGDADMSAPLTEAAAGTGEVAAVVAQARRLFELGRFEDAANLLHPLLDVASPDAAAVTLHDRVDAAAARNRALLGRLARERSAGRWSAVVGTIGELEAVRPLSKELTKLRGTARRSARVQALVGRATGLMAKGRDAEALAVVERGLELGPNRRLEAMRERLSARLAAPATRPSPAAGRREPPPAGGAPARSNAGPTVRPPANVPQGAIPARPDLPNPTGGGASVAPTVSGGGATGGASCHEHDGVRECH